MRLITTKNIYLSIILIFMCMGCQTKGNTQEDKFESEQASMSAHESDSSKQPGEWESLFDGKTTDGWRGVYGDDFPNHAWKVHNGVLTILESNGRQGGAKGGGSIITEDEYSDFELQLDFKLTKGANSGIKYFVIENPDFFEGDPSGRGIGLEFQVLDDANHPDAKKGVNGNRTVGSLYDMIPAAKDKKMNPIGEWNHVRLISNGKHIEHWLNGEKVLEYERGSDAFKALVDKSKYNHYDNFGMEPKGHILLQDHGNEVSYRNIKIRTFK